MASPNTLKATTNGSLNPIEDCYLIIPNTFKEKRTVYVPRVGVGQVDMSSERKIVFNNLPDISDSKSAIYNNEAIIGRSSPFYTYSHSGDRQISMQMHFFVVDRNDAQFNLHNLNWIRSAVYPRISNNNLPFEPPPICRLKCGDLLASNQEICVILQSYNVKFPTDVAWDVNTFIPFRFDVDTTWTVVYTSSDLPHQNRIIQSGR